MKKILVFTLCLVFSLSINASFPVNKNKVEKTEVTQDATNTIIKSEVAEVEINANLNISPEDAISPAVASDDNTMIITVLLWLFLGGLAGHRWYAGKSAGWNILFILTLGGFGIWWLIDGINILTDNF